MSYLHRSRSRGFTLLELVVVIVVLAVLAAISVPTFRGVIERSHDESALVGLSAYAREVQALSALDRKGFRSADFEAAVADMSAIAAGPGLSAATVTLDGGIGDAGLVRAKRSTPTSPAVISYAISEDRSSAGVAAVSAADHCVAVQFDASHLTEVTISDLDACTGYGALTGTPIDGVDPTPIDPSEQTPSAPFGFAGKGMGGFAVLSWEPVPGTALYRVFRTGTADPVAETSALTASVPQGYGTSETYTLVAVNEKGPGPASKPVDVLHVPAAPTGVSVRMEGSDAIITWSAVFSATGYEVFRDASDTVAAFTFGNDSVTARVPVAAGQTAVFVVAARNGAGLSEGSAPAGVTAQPAPPASVTASLSGDTVTVSWDSSEGATSYDVFYENDTLIRNVPSGLSTTVTLDEGDSAAFRVRSKNDAGAGPASQLSNTVTRATAAPTGLAGTTSGESALLSWTPVPKATSYNVYRGDSITPEDTVPAAEASRPLPAGTTASFRVSAVNAGGESALSSPVSVTAAPAAPEAPAVSDVTDSSVRLSWAGVAGATGYLVEYRLASAAGWLRTTSEDTSQTLSGLDWGREYHFRVLATNAGGTSDPGALSSATTANAPEVEYHSAAYDDSSWLAVTNLGATTNLSADMAAREISHPDVYGQGRTYYRKVFTASAGVHDVHWQVDDAGVVRIDGAPVSNGGTVNLSAGQHTITMELTNMDIRGGSPTSNPGKFALTVRKGGTPVVRSDSSWKATAGSKVHFSQAGYMTRFVSSFPDRQIWEAPVDYGTLSSNNYYHSTSWWNGSPSARLISSAHDRTDRGGEYWDVEQGLYTEYRTELSAFAASGTLRIFCDDICNVYVDGQHLGTYAGGDEYITVNLPSSIRAGSVLGVSVKNTGTAPNPSMLVATIRSKTGSLLRNSDTTNWLVNRPNVYGPTEPTRKYSFDENFVPAKTLPLR